MQLSCKFQLHPTELEPATGAPSLVKSFNLPPLQCVRCMQSPAGRGAAGRTRSQAQGSPQVQPPQVPQQQQPPEIAQLQAQVQQLLTQVQNQNNTIANLQQQQAAAATAPAPARFAVTPAAHATGFLDFDKKGDTILFKEATKSLCQDPAERFGVGLIFHGRL